MTFIHPLPDYVEEEGIDPFPEEGMIDRVVKMLVEQNPALLDDERALLEAVNELGCLRVMGVLADLWLHGRIVSRWNPETRQLTYRNA